MRQAQQRTYEETGCINHDMQQRQQNAPIRCDREIQTSPSDSPAVWPPPSVHGSPRRRRRLFDDPDGNNGGKCECSSGSSRERPPSRRELYHWLSMSEPGARLFRAKYVYRPLRDSPNDNPETELSLTPGDYLLIFGDLDEDFYYRGELWTGERGLVPSNYVEPLPMSVLGMDATPSCTLDSLSSLNMIQHRTAPAPSNRLLSRAASERVQSGGVGVGGGGVFVHTPTTSMMRSAKSVDAFTAGGSIEQLLPQHQQQQQSTSADMSALSTMGLVDVWPGDASMCPFPVVDVSNVQVQEIRPFDGARVPCPRDLLVERQLTKSVLLSWSAPLNALCPIAQYHVCVDGEVRAVVPAGYKTKALVEDVDSRKIHRISVRAVSDAGRSPDEACTVTLGQGSLIRPQDLKISNVTPVSCEVSWYPSYSNCEHLVLLNGLKVGTCPAGVYRVQMRGLIPSTMYRCAVRVKDPKAVLEEKPVESFVDFKTLPKAGLPDPPSDVHCEPGPQDGTLLVTWRPVISQPKPPSRAAVSGYLVYADGRKVCEVDSPSGDHAVLRLQDLNDDPPLFITVKTKTREGAVSSDSNVVRVPRTTAAAFPSTSTDIFPFLNTRTPSTQVTKDAKAQDLVGGAAAAGAAAVGALGVSQGFPTSTSISTASPLPSTSLLQLAPGTASSTINERTVFSTTTITTTTGPSYYVFHPRLASQRLDTAGLASTGGDGTLQLLTVATHQEKPSLLEMETDYLSRHHQLKERAAVYQTSNYPPATITTVAPSTRLFQPQQTLVPTRQSAFTRRSYSLEETQPGDYDAFGPQPAVVPGLYPTSGPGTSPSVNAARRVRNSMGTVTPFNGPQQRSIQVHGGTVPVDDPQWSDSNPFRSAAVSGKATRFETRAHGSRGQYWPPQSERIMPYGGDLDMDPATAAAYDMQSKLPPGIVPSALAAKGGPLTARHRRRLQDSAEARAFSEPDLLHHEGQNRYFLQQPPPHYHGRRHRSKTPTRLVVALYDYSPRHMSPNPNGHFDELAFRKGQLISVHGEKDLDGFYRGEVDGRIGLVPSNLVVEVEGGVEALLLNSPSTTAMVPDYDNRAGYAGRSGYGRSLPQDRHYGPYDEVGVWDSRNGGSDPTLSRQQRHHPSMREQRTYAEGEGPSSFDNAYDRYSDTQDRYGGTSRHRRSKYKQKSHSLEYDLDRRDYYDQEEQYDRSGLFRPIVGGRQGAPPEYGPSQRLSARSLDRFHYQRQQSAPRGDPYAATQVERTRHPGQRIMPPVGSRNMWPPSPRQPYREGGLSDQDSEAELLHYHRQPQQRKSMAQPRRMSMFDQRQQVVGPEGYPDQEEWHPDDIAVAQFSGRQRGPAGYDRSGASAEETLRRGSRPYVSEEQLMAEARKKQQPMSDLFYDSPTDGKELGGGTRRRDSLRRGGRHQLDQNIRDAVVAGVARRMVAKFDYDPKILSPNPGAEREELTFRAGDTILVYGDVDEDGFYVGELGNRRGLVPCNYLVREQDAGLSAVPNTAQLNQQPSASMPQHSVYDSQPPQTSGTSRSKKESLVSFAPMADMTAQMAGQQPSPSPGTEKKLSVQTGSKSSTSGSGPKQPSAATGTKRQPGQLKKADSTVGQKVPQKKVSVAGGPTPGRKASTAAGKSGMPGKSSGQEDGGIGKVWKKIVE